MRNEVLKQAKRIVVKIGSSLVSSREAGLEPDRIDRLAEDLAALRAAGRDVLVVSSGAIVSGIKKLSLKEYPKSLPVKQAAAAVGQSRLMWAYEKSFERLDIKVAQILLTHHDLADRRRFLNARHTLAALIEFQVIPIINENDTVAVDEIRVGDNDTLAAEVAHLVDADLLVILSDIDGLFTEDPRKNPSAELIPLIAEITDDIERRAGISTTFGSTGGMATKVRAAKKVGEYGVATLIMALRAVHPESIPVNTLHPVAGTPLEHCDHLTPQRCLKVLCLFRFLHPRTEIRIAGGREHNLRSLQPLALYPADSVFVNGYLTTPGAPAPEVWGMIRDLGFTIEVDYQGAQPTASSGIRS